MGLKNIKRFSGSLSSTEKKEVLKLQVFVMLLTFSEISFVLLLGNMISWLENPEISLTTSLINHLGYSLLADDTFTIIFGFLIAMVLMSALSLYSSWNIAMKPQVIGAQMSSRVYTYYMMSNAHFHEEHSSSSLISKLSQEVQRVTNQILQPLAQLNASLLLGTVFITYLVSNYPSITLLGGGFIIIFYALAYLLITRALSRQGKRVSITHKKSITLMKDGFQGYVDYLTTNNRAFINDYYEKNISKFGRSQGLIRAFGTMPKFVLESSVIFFAAFYFIYLRVFQDVDIALSASDIAIVGVVGLKLLPLLHKIYAMFTSIIGNFSAYESIENDLLSSVNTTSHRRQEKVRTEKGTFSNTSFLALKNVHQTFDGIKDTINGVNLSVNCGEKIALVGPSGSGKSSILKVMAGVISHHQGSLKLFESDYDSLSYESLYQDISYLPQTIYLSTGSLLENICLGENPNDVDPERLRFAVEASQVNEFLPSLPEGLNSEIGEDGSTLSGGQRQRIGLARSFYRNAKANIFDEATSALDAETEKNVINNLLKMDSALILVTHRLENLVNFDRIYVVQNGGIKESGSYLELIDKSDIFMRLRGDNL